MVLQMKRIRFIARKVASLALTVMFAATAGCADIDYSAVEFTEETTLPIITEEVVTTSTEATVAEHAISIANIVNADYSGVAEAEDGDEVLDYLDGYSGDGYIQLDNGDYETFTFDVPESQHYKVTIRVCTQSAKLKLIVGGTALVVDRQDGADTPNGMIHGVYYIDDAIYFKDYSLNGVYLEKGENRLTIQSIAGTAYLDNMTLTNGSTVDNVMYEISSIPVDRNANSKTLEIMAYLKSIYGQKTLTAQYVTPNTNTEIEAIYMATGRFPAIRCADLMPYSSYNPEFGIIENNDLALAVDWSNNGGLVSYSWSWFAPTSSSSHYYAERTDFDLRKAVTTTNISILDTATLEEMYGNGELADETFNIITDIDRMAENLLLLQENNVTVLFRPLMEAGNGWYWWGKDSDSYKWLWQLLFSRLSDYHQLHNLLWVWNGENYDFYPGDSYVDIISIDNYNHMPGSSNQRFIEAAKYSITTKAVAMSETAILPNPDLLYRDNAKWLWTAVWRGDYLINADGSLNEQWTTRQELNYAYNHEFYITLDELDF